MLYEVITVVFVLALGAFGTIGLKDAKALEITSVDLSSVDDGTYTGIYESYNFV